MTSRKIQYWVIPPEADGEFVAHITTVRLTPERFSVTQTFSTSCVKPCVYTT